MARNRANLAIVWLGLVAAACLPAQAQGGPGGNMNAVNSAEIAKSPDITPDQREFRDKAFMRDAERARRPNKEQTIAAAAKALDGLQIACKVADARVAARGPVTSGGKQVDTTTYETACDSGIGYFVVSADTGDAFSCFAAQASHDKDIAAGREPGTLCTLPANGDSKSMAAAMLTRLGVACQVSAVQWIGLSAKAATEYTEVACADRSGYVLTSAAPGSTSAPAVLSCADAAKRGIFCRLTAAGQPAITLQTFRDTLARNKIVCTAGDDDIRHVGQENNLKRHVVEFRCSEFPRGLVAFVPLADSKAPFEVTDCTTAAKRGVTCRWH